MAKDGSIDRQGRESAVNAAVGGLLSWVAGKDSVKRGTSPADGAMGELLSWVTGKDVRVLSRPSSRVPERGPGFSNHS
jgi:hypothetical protein